MYTEKNHWLDKTAKAYGHKGSNQHTKNNSESLAIKSGLSKQDQDYLNTHESKWLEFFKRFQALKTKRYNNSSVSLHNMQPAGVTSAANVKLLTEYKQDKDYLFHFSSGICKLYQ